MIQSFSFQWYNFIATRTLVRTEVLLTQLVFEHSLRIRLKAEASTDAKATPEADAKLRTESEASIATADTASMSTSGDVSEVASGSGSARESSEVSTVAPSREPSKAGSDTTLKASTDSKAKESKEKQKDDSNKYGGNLIGKINNLVTTDLNNITAGRDFLMISTSHFLHFCDTRAGILIVLVLYVPLQISLCLTFLYKVLGWSAFVGFAVMLVLVPIPGYFASKLQKAQTEKMKKV